MDYPAGWKPEFPRVVDSTMRADFVACPQKFFQAYVQKRSLSGDSIHLVAGAAYARGLEIVRNFVYGPAKLPLERALVESIPHVWAEYGAIEVPAGYEQKGPIGVVKALVAYFDRFPPLTDHIQPFMKKNGEPATEFSFTIPMEIAHPVTGEPILYAGRTDLIGVYNGTLWVVDDKTASQLGPSWDRQWSLRAQLTGYCYAAKRYGLDVSGAIIRGISFLKGGAFGFSEPIEYRANWQLERWWEQLHRDVARMIGCWTEVDDAHPLGYWDYNLADACTSFGSGCPFAALCKVSNPNEWLGQYEYKSWNPLDLNPVGKQKVIPVFSS